MDKREKSFFFDNNILLSILYNNTTAREKILQSGSLCINSYGITHRRDSSKRFALFVTRVSEPTTWNLILPTEYRLRSRVNFKIDQVASSLNSKTVLLSDYTNLTNEANYSQFTSMDFISPSHYRIFINSLSLSRFLNFQKEVNVELRDCLDLIVAEQALPLSPREGKRIFSCF